MGQTPMEPDQVEAELPRHIAVVMDGNGRWARRRGLNRIEGHIEGRRATRRLVEECVSLGIEFLTVYAFSTENWSRSSEEVGGLMELIEAALKAEVDDLDASNVRFVASGRLHELPEGLQRAIKESEARTRDNTGLVLNTAINYSGRVELVDVCRSIAGECVNGTMSVEDISIEALSKRLYRPDIPDVDLFIRPGGEMRVSNFLLWQIAYAEIYVCPVLWPDFGPQHLHQALSDYRKRERRFGSVPSPVPPQAGEQGPPAKLDA